MLDDAQRARVIGLWREATGCPDGFSAPGWVLASTPDHRAAPPGWIGIIEVDGSVVVAAAPAIAAVIEARLGSVASIDELTRAASAAQVLGPFAHTLGPAILFYGERGDADAPAHRVVGPLALDDPLAVGVMNAAEPAELVDSGLANTDSGVFVAVDDAGRPAAGCGWSTLPFDIAHICMLTSRDHRRQGFGRSAALAALSAAGERGMLPQWRVAEGNVASIALAQRLGLERVGRQFSVLLDDGAPPAV